MRSSWIEIDLDALRKNTAFILKRLSPGTKLLAPLKGNGYGHGAVQCARVFAEMGASYFGVAIPEEGVELREAGFRQPVLIFGHTFEDDYDLLFDYDLIPNISYVQEARALSALAVRRKTRLTVHVSVDTGLHRLGLDLNETTVSQIAEIAALPGLYMEGLFSMFSTGDQYPDTAYCHMQFQRFVDLCAAVEAAGVPIPCRHICDSGATLLFPEMHLDMVRPGSSLYGSYCGDVTFPDIEAYPVMSVHSRLACVREIERGEFVGYNCTWAAQKPSVIGVVPCGYVDGISRLASNRGAALVRGVRCPIIGNICMDQLMLDLTKVPGPQIGDEVVLLGSQGEETITLEEAGAFAGTSDTEFICRQGVRLPRRYMEKGKQVPF